jgi:CubicO group peptidase (beta-lactamase class C family)
MLKYLFAAAIVAAAASGHAQSPAPAPRVLGVLIERVSGQPLDQFLAARILKPLGMNDTAFHVPEAKLGRLAEALPADPETGRPITLMEVRVKPRFLSGGGGMVSTAQDYFRFAQMLLNGGELDGVRLLSRKTVEYMTADHLGPLARPDRRAYFPGAGYGWSLGFAVRTQAGLSQQPASIGDYYWAGYGGTYVWIDPKERIVGIMMLMWPEKAISYWMMMRWMVYSALER